MNLYNNDKVKPIEIWKIVCLILIGIALFPLIRFLIAVFLSF